MLEVAHKIRDSLTGQGLRVRVDDRDHHRPGFKFSEWELKGVPVRIEIGPKDVAAHQVVLVRRAGGAKEQVATSAAVDGMAGELERAQQDLYDDALEYRKAHTHTASTYDELRDGITATGGLWVGAWCGRGTCEERVTADTKATIRTLPLTPEDPGAPCAVCGQKGAETATWARAY